LQGADATSITIALSELVGRPVILLDGLLRPVTQQMQWPGSKDAEVHWEPTEAYVGRVLQTMAAERRSMRLPPLPAWGVDHGCVLAPVVAGDSTLGYLAILEPATPDEDGSTPEEADLLAAQHAASVYALALMRERLTAEVTTELRDELLEGLLDGQVTDEQATRERARRLGYDEALAYQVLALLPDDATNRDPTYPGGDGAWAAGWRRRVLDSVSQLVRDRAPGAIVSRRREELVVLLPDASEPAPADLGKTVTLYVASMYPEWPLTVGIGGLCRAPREIARSYAQARRAAEVALRFGRRGEVVTFDDLGFYRLLFQISDRNELRAFVEQVLGPLLAYDQKHRTDFVQTIATYLANNTASGHGRRLRPRQHRRLPPAAHQAITGLDLSKTEDCLLAKTALRSRSEDVS
jgi:hypothetical protein